MSVHICAMCCTRSLELGGLLPTNQPTTSGKRRALHNALQTLKGYSHNQRPQSILLNRNGVHGAFGNSLLLFQSAASCHSVVASLSNCCLFVSLSHLCKFVFVQSVVPLSMHTTQTSQPQWLYGTQGPIGQNIISNIRVLRSRKA